MHPKEFGPLYTINIITILPLQIVLGTNSSTSRWVDVVEMAQAHELEVRTSEKKDVTELFLRNMDEFKKTTGLTGTGNLMIKLFNLNYTLINYLIP